MKKIACLILTGIFTGISASEAISAGIGVGFTAEAADFTSKDVDALQYTYEIYPLLEPFNEYFYVKTENPHPESFRFSDKDSPYSETSVIYSDENVYADVKYENEEFRRVDGGYIFKSFTTNGGEVELQVHEEITEEEFTIEVYGTSDPEFSGYSPYHGMPVDSYKEYINENSYYLRGYYKWKDTGIKIELPELCDNCDFLIQNYSVGTEFFSDMEAIQKSFSSVCLYSGSFIRGEIYRSGDRGWRMAGAPYVDQIFYINSPYSRKDNKNLFSSAIYPYIYDSLGFPSMMKKVAMRLDESAVCEWSDSSHAHVNVTLNGETKIYGGQGNGEGQGITDDMISRRYIFGENNEATNLTDAKDILDEYSTLEINDDIPRDGELTWKKIYDTVGDGEWVDMGGKFTYLYQRDDKAEFTYDEFGVGHSIYWGGSLGFCADMWVDGRYINKFKRFVSGATLEEYPESAVLVRKMTVPEITEITREWNAETGKYTFTSAEINEKVQKNVVFRYDKELQMWKADTHMWDDNYFSVYYELMNNGLLDEKYYDMITLTNEEYAALVNTDNTNDEPDSGVIFDGYAPHGTRFMKGDCNNDSELNIADAVTLQKWLLCDPDTADVNTRNTDICKDNQLDVFDLCLLKRMVIEAAAVPKNE